MYHIKLEVVLEATVVTPGADVITTRPEITKLMLFYTPHIQIPSFAIETRKRWKKS